MLLSAALVLEHGFGLAPCALCLTQRAFVLLAGLFVAVGLAHNPRLGIYPLLATLAAVVGGYFSVRHLYLLTLPPDQVPGCGVDFDYLIDAFPLIDILRAHDRRHRRMRRAVVRDPGLGARGLRSGWSRSPSTTGALR